MHSLLARLSSALRLFSRGGDIVPLLVVGTVCGIGGGLATLGFLWLIYTIELKMSTSIGAVLGSEGMRWRVWIVVIVGAVVVGQLNRIFKHIGIVGADEIILRVQTQSGGVPVISGLLSALAAAISLASGASLGQYGPVMSLGATIGSAIDKLKLKIPHLSALTMASGLSAAITVAFHAPITAVIFVHEVILRHFSIQAFAPVALAAAVGEMLLSMTGDRYPLFMLVEEVQPDSGNYILFILMGILGAIIADSFMTLSVRMRQWVDQTRMSVAIQPIVAAILLASIASYLPQSFGSGTQYFSGYLSGNTPELNILLILLVVKVILSASCFAFRFVGGMFAPALFQGLLFGLIVGHFVAALGYRIEPFYAGIIGMVSVASPVIGGPIAMVIMVFELTGNYWLATSAMLAVLSANLVSYRWLGRSYYDLLLRNRGYDLSGNRAQLILQTRSIESYIDREGVVTAFAQESIATVLERLGRLNETVVYIVDVEGRLEGIANLKSLVAAQYDESTFGGHENVALIMQKPQQLFYPETSIWLAINKLQHSNERQPVIERKSGEFVGTVVAADLLKVYMKLGDEINAEQTGRAVGKTA